MDLWLKDKYPTLTDTELRELRYPLCNIKQPYPMIHWDLLANKNKYQHYFDFVLIQYIEPSHCPKCNLPYQEAIAQLLKELPLHNEQPCQSSHAEWD